MDTNLAGALGDIQRTLGNIEGSIKGIEAAFTKHVADDDAVEVRVRAVEVAQANQKGSRRVWGIVGNAVSVAVGAAAAYFGAKHV